MVQPQLAQSDEALCEYLRQFARQHPQLQLPYNDAYQELDRQYQTQVREKFIFNTNGNGTASVSPDILARQLLNADDLIAAIQRLPRRRVTLGKLLKIHTPRLSGVFALQKSMPGWRTNPNGE